MRDCGVAVGFAVGATRVHCMFARVTYLPALIALEGQSVEMDMGMNAYMGMNAL
jgi:hypothetical protein